MKMIKEKICFPFYRRSSVFFVFLLLLVTLCFFLHWRDEREIITKKLEVRRYIYIGDMEIYISRATPDTVPSFIHLGHQVKTYNMIMSYCGVLIPDGGDQNTR